MIVEFFMGLIAGLIQWVLDQWDGFALDAQWLVDLDVQIQRALQWSNGLGIWVDWGLANTVIAFVLLTFVACLGVKLVLRIVSHFTGGGGAS